MTSARRGILRGDGSGAEANLSRAAAATGGVAGNQASDASRSRRSIIAALRELAAQSLQPAPRSQLHGGTGDVQRSSRLGIGQPDEVPRNDRRPLTGSQPVHCGEQATPVLPPQELVLGELSPRHRLERACAAMVELSASRCTPVISRLVADNSQEPRSERGARAKASERSICLDERLLHDVLRICGGIDDQKRRPECGALVLSHERLIRVMVAAACALDQLRFALFGRRSFDGRVGEWTNAHPDLIHRSRPSGYRFRTRRRRIGTSGWAEFSRRYTDASADR
jgi:hypothetical protein